jgi:hypothetical protein
MKGFVRVISFKYIKMPGEYRRTANLVPEELVKPEIRSILSGQSIEP